MGLLNGLLAGFFYSSKEGDPPPKLENSAEICCDEGRIVPGSDNLEYWAFYTTHKSLDAVEATQKLRKHEKEVPIKVPGFQKLKTQLVRVASLEPVEDRYSYHSIQVGECQRWPSWGLFDGHSGWATADLLSKVLAPYVSRELRKLDGSYLNDPGQVKLAIEKAFVKLDEEIIEGGLKAIDGSMTHPDAMCRIAPASSGSCATMAFLDPASSIVYVACVGDSRAVLGRKAVDNESWTAEALSTDQTGYDEKEVQRIEAEHPGETPVDKAAGRVLNCAVTRSFGDNRWKWPLKDLERWRDLYFGRNPLSNYYTPPYLTAQPAIETAHIKSGDFLILASDGFWNHMKSNEDAVHLVSMWLQSNSDTGPKEKHPAEEVENSNENQQEKTGDGMKTTGYPYEFVMKRSDFIVEDHHNVATHLARNALGGRNQDLFCSLMSTMSPDSKEARDDLTVIVVLF